MPIPRVLILGGRFGGLEALRQLRKLAPPSELHITLVDRVETAAYVPMGHEAIAHPERSHAGVNLAQAAALHGAELLRAEIVAIHASGRSVTLRRVHSPSPLTGPPAPLGPAEEVRADAIIIALGARLGPPADFGGPERLFSHRSESEIARTRAALAELLAGGTPRIAVIGAGLTGVELAGELAALTHPHLHPQPHPHPHRGGRRAAEVVLVMGQGGLLPSLAAPAKEAARHALTSQGVELMTGRRATGLDEGRVHFDDGTTLSADLCLWGGGIRPIAALAETGVGRTHDGFLRADDSLRCLDDDGRPIAGVFALGDAAVIERRADLQRQELRSMHGRLVDPFFQAWALAHNVMAMLRGVPDVRRHRPFARFPHAISIGRSVLLEGYGLLRDFGAPGAWGRRQFAAWWARRYI